MNKIVDDRLRGLRLDKPIDAIRIFYKEVDPDYKNPQLYNFVQVFMRWYIDKMTQEEE